MKNWKKVLCLVVSLLMLSFVFAGCTKDAAEDTKTTSPEETKQNTQEAQETQETAPEATKAPEDYVGEVTLWCGWKDNFMLSWEPFAAIYTNVALDFVAVETEAYLQKMQTSVAAGMELPDLILGDMEWRGQILALDIFEDLKQEPYNVDPNAIMDFDIPLISNAKGEICGLETGAAVTGMAYKADLALKYFGTDDPDELFEMMSDWDSFIQKGIEVKQASNGEVYMLAGNGGVVPLRYQNPLPEVDGDKLVNVDEIWGEVFTYYEKMRDADIIDELSDWSAGWSASFTDDTHIFYNLPTWGASYMVKPNDPDASTEGRWRIMNTPGYGNVIQGGNMMGIWKESDVKECVWKYIEINYYAPTDEFIDMNLVEFNQVVPIKSVVENYDFTQFEPDPMFGGQDNIEMYTSKLLERLSYRPVNPYDSAIHDCVNLVLNAMRKDASIDADAAMEMFLQEIANTLPDLEIER